MSAHIPTTQLLPRLQRSAVNVFAPVQRELDRIFEELGSGWSAFADVAPRLDLVETKEGLELSFELPGMTRNDVKIAIDDDVLTVSGEKKADKDSKDRNSRILERSYGAFERSVTLPRNVEASKIKATMADGVLKIVAPKKAGAEPKTIEIQSAK